LPGNAAAYNPIFMETPMHYLRAITLSLAIVLGLILLVTAAWILVKSARSLRLPEPGPITRKIIFTETGCRIFNLEKRDASGNDILALLDGPLLTRLRDDGYEVSMAVDDFNDRFAGAVKRLNRHGIRVWIWPLHPIEDGYWLSADNAHLFPGLYARMKGWIAGKGLEVHGIMLDMEPSYRDVQEMRDAATRGGPVGAVGYLVKRRDRELHLRARGIYGEAVKLMKADGYEVSVFNIPYVLDDRCDGDSSIQEMFHVAGVNSDMPVYMLYRSYFRDSGLGLGTASVVSYARSLAGGSAGIGDYMVPELTFSQLEEDMRIAARFSPVVHIYNLEGLVRKGWLERMPGIDLRQPVRVPIGSALFIQAYRAFFMILDVCYGASRYFAVALLLALWGLIGIALFRWLH
jgi:hypothetical protein